MCRLVRLVPRSDERKAAQEAFNNAIALEFNDAFGTDENSLESWQALCERLQIDPIPDTLNECRRVCHSSQTLLEPLNKLLIPFTLFRRLSKVRM